MHTTFLFPHYTLQIETDEKHAVKFSFIKLCLFFCVYMSVFVYTHVQIYKYTHKCIKA